MTDARAQEVRALRFSSALTILFTAGAATVAVVSDSETMTLEAMSGLVSLLAIFVVGKIHEPANPRYHFGYAKYEPLMVAVEGVLIAAVCVSAIVYAAKDLVHADPVSDPALVIGYALAGFLVSVAFGRWMRRVGKRTAAPLVTAEAELWVIEGWLSFGVFLAFLLGKILSRSAALDYSAYVDPIVCIVLSLILLKTPAVILKESFQDLVDANPFAETANTVEESAREAVLRYHLKALEWVRVRKAGRRLFVMVSFLHHPTTSLEELERVRTAVSGEMAGLNPDADICVLFRGG
jgi:cation diffusion facilitator family transporter